MTAGQSAAGRDDRVVLCETRRDCADPNVNRWHCMRGFDSEGHVTKAAVGVCPLKICVNRGANR